MTTVACCAHVCAWKACDSATDGVTTSSECKRTSRHREGEMLTSRRVKIQQLGGWEVKFSLCVVQTGFQSRPAHAWEQPCQVNFHGCCVRQCFGGTSRESLLSRQYEALEMQQKKSILVWFTNNCGAESLFFALNFGIVYFTSPFVG